ncbi:MAG: aminotransferase class I/II-fold pyridoxal phosphate-dependent enzyme [Pseudomonadota bacterium]
MVNKKRFPVETLSGSLRDFRAITGANMLDRTDGFFQWQDARRKVNLWPYAKSTTTAPKTHCAARNDDGTPVKGVNFASQDYLSLSSHPKVKEAAREAIDEYGVHSAGSAALLGNTRQSLKLERRISAFLDGRETVLYPTGWSAGFAAIQGVVRPDDHVILDVLAHSCLQEGARASTRNIYLHGHLNLRALERRLQRIRANDTVNGILVVTESLFSMHSDTPDIAAMRALCDNYDATLLVDCAHDFGCIGEDGRGHISLQNVLDDVDIMIGSFSKTFASNGGFISVKSRSLAEYLKYYSATQTFSNALSPVQAAAVLAAFEIVDSDEGRERRRRLMGNILFMREQMTQAGLEALGDPSPIVPVRVGAEGLARLASRDLSDLGAIANLVEYPAVPQGGARFRVQVMSDHTHEDVSLMVKLMLDSMRSAEREYLALSDTNRQLIGVTSTAPNADELARDAA